MTLHLKSQSSFPFLKKQVSLFPLMDEIRDFIENEWKKIEKRFPLNRLGNPMSEQDSAILDGPPVMEAAVVHLAKNITLPMGDSASFKDQTNNNCKAAIALTSVSNALWAWTKNIETAIHQDVPKEDIIKALEEFKLSADFVGEVAIDTIKCSAKSMLHAVMAKRAL